MKRSMPLFVVLIVSLLFIASSCARGISPYEAANGKAKCGRYVQ